MPYYEYHCAANGRTVEVRHGMSDRVDTWGALAERAGIEPGETPSSTPVERWMSVPAAISGDGDAPAFGGCGSGCACGPRG